MQIEKSTATGRKKLDKISITLRMYPKTRALIIKALAPSRTSSMSEYAERAIINQLEKDGVR